MRTIPVEERRARLGRRHLLAPGSKVTDPTDVARGLVVLHSTDPATVFLAAAARLVDPQVAAVERALYEDRTLVRMLAMRRTMWVVPDELVSVVEAACTQAIAERERRRLIQLLTTLVPDMDEAATWLAEVEEATLAALAARGGAAFGTELSTDVPRLRTQYTYAEGKAYGGTQTFTTRILNVMSMEGRIVRGRPRGAWNSSQYRWSPIEAWLPQGITPSNHPATDPSGFDSPVPGHAEDCAAETVTPLDRTAAQARLVEAWLARFGPGTVGDLKWWTGLTLGEVRRALARLDTVEVQLDGGAGVVLAGDVEAVEPPEPWVALLPALDPTSMGWAERDWYLGPHRALLFDRSGNVGPTVWSDGRIVGGWAQRRAEGADGDGEVVVRLVEDIGAEATAAVEAEAARLTAWIGDVRVRPRFRTPLERELAG